MKKRFLAGALLAALLLALCVFALPAAYAAAEDAPGDLPEVDIHSWEFLLANSYNSCGWWYQPEYASIEGQGLDPRVAPHARELIEAARDAGYECYLAMAFRNTDWIFNHYTWNLAAHGGDPIATVKDFLPLGANEHQTGLCVDLTDQKDHQLSYDEFEDPEIVESELYAWLLANAPDYGFILRYPADKAYWYGVPCRHAHFRYVGVAAAKYITEHQLCLEEFISLYDPDAVYVPEHGRLSD
ncbi:MAG: M15 family metallopeptidase [Oscillospiraceae bacterium]|nr:M15 family metallopeptidase [Oscillospiraceae bacterium]